MMQPPNDDILSLRCGEWMLCHPLQVHSRQILRNNKISFQKINFVKREFAYKKNDYKLPSD
jgi:hypothetical protein